MVHVQEVRTDQSTEDCAVLESCRTVLFEQHDHHFEGTHLCHSRHVQGVFLVFCQVHHAFDLCLETCAARTRAIIALASSLPFAGRVRGL